MSTSSFLTELRKASSSKSSRVVAHIAKELQKLKAQNISITDEGLGNNGVTVKGRIVLEHGKLVYSRKITTLPTHKVPDEPDGTFLTLWLKANHTGFLLKDSSKWNGDITSVMQIKANHGRHICLVDSATQSDGSSGGTALDSGYLGQKDGSNSCTVWHANGTDESYQIYDNTERLELANTTIGFSITAWVKIFSFGLHNTVERRICAKSDDVNNAYALFITPTNKAVVGFKHAGTQFKVETPATLTAGPWYFIAATFKSSVTKEARIYLNGTVSTTAYSPTIVYPDLNSFPANRFQFLTNGLAQTIDPTTSDLPPPHINDTGDFHGLVRDLRIWREKILTPTQISQFNNNKTTISNLTAGQSHIAGFIWAPLDTTPSFTTTSFTTESFTT